MTAFAGKAFEATMVEKSSSPEDRAKVWHLIKKIGIALLVSRAADGGLHARPLAAGQKQFDGKLWFITSEGSAKLDEILREPSVLVAYSDTTGQSYVTVSGTAEISIDPQKTREIWDMNARLWFPQGPEESDIRLICVTVASAEFWDRPSSRLFYAYHYVKTRLTGRAPSLVGENKVVYF
jgi:general stress protein 26